MEGGALRRRIARMTLRAWEFRARVRDRGLVELAPPVRRCRRGGRSSATPRFRFGLRSSERGLETRARGTRPSSAAFCRRGGRSSATPGSASGCGVRSADSRRGLVELAPPVRPFVVVEGGALRRPVPPRAAEFGARTRDAGSWNSPLQRGLLSSWRAELCDVPVPLRAAEFGARTRDAGSWNSPLQCGLLSSWRAERFWSSTDLRSQGDRFESRRD